MPGWAESDPHAYWEAADAHERANDGLERTADTWFKRYNGKALEQGGARKVSTSSKEWLESTREAWAKHANRALARAGSAERIDHRSLSDRVEEAREAGDQEKAAELSREPGKHLGPGAAIEAKYQLGEREIRSSAVAEAGEIEDRNGRWANRWETVNRELSRMQEELGQLMEDLRGLERTIREMAAKIADRPRRVFDRRQTGEMVRGAFRTSQEPQRGRGKGELPQKPREPNVCR